MTTTTFLPKSRTLHLSIPAGAAPLHPQLPDVPQYHPAAQRLRQPRGTQRIFTDSELRSAATMLDKLCAGYDQMPVDFAETVHPHTADQVLDIVADRMLDRLRIE